MIQFDHGNPDYPHNKMTVEYAGSGEYRCRLVISGNVRSSEILVDSLTLLRSSDDDEFWVGDDYHGFWFRLSAQDVKRLEDYVTGHFIT